MIELKEVTENNFYEVIQLKVSDAQHQGKGYGRKIVEAVIEMGQNDKGYDALIADYVEGNGQMKYLLESLGFERIGFDEENDEVLMSLNIDYELLFPTADFICNQPF